MHRERKPSGRELQGCWDRKLSLCVVLVTEAADKGGVIGKAPITSPAT